MPQRGHVLSDVASPRWNGSAVFDPGFHSAQTLNFNELRESLEEDWRRALNRLSVPPLTEMMDYALSGGKCLRGLLLLAVADACNGSGEQAREAAVAIEMIHAASLVVDDLPALDDTSMRRGALSLHKRFGEAAAILTAHALVAAAFELTAQISSEPERLLQITRLFAAAIGPRGMSCAELIHPSDSAGSDNDVRALKTGGLFQVAARMGGILAGAEPQLAQDLGQLGLGLGTCYQLVDDLRDEFLEPPSRSALGEACRQSLQQCAELFNLVRKRLHKPRPVEIWMSWFRDSTMDVVEAAESGSKRNQA